MKDAKNLKQGDTVYYKNAAMTYERTYFHPKKEKYPTIKVFCSWRNDKTGEREEGLFDISEITSEPTE